MALALVDVGELADPRADPGALLGVVGHGRAGGLAPLRGPERGVLRGPEVALCDLASLDLVRRQQAGAAPALERARQLPREVGGVADPRVHPESALRNDQVRGVPGDEDAAVAVPV